MIIFFTLILGCKPGAPVQQKSLVTADFYVSPSGSDEYQGTFSKPFATFNAAAEAVKEKLSKGQLGEIRVVFRGGEYFVENPAILDSALSGRSSPVIFESYPGETACFIGTMIDKKWTLHGNLKTISAESDPESLYADGKRLSIVRWPSKGFLTLTDIPNLIVDISAYPEKERKLLKKGAVRLKIFSSKMDTTGRKLLPFFADASISISGKKLQIKIANEIVPLLSSGTFYIESGKSGITDDSFFYNQKEKAVYVKNHKSGINKGINSPILILSGTKDSPLSNLVFRNLDFSQTAVKTDLISLSFSKAILFENCNFSLSGQNGAAVQEGCSDINFLNCRFSSIFRHAVAAAGNTLTNEPVKALTITECAFTDIGTSGTGSAIKAWGINGSIIKNNWINNVTGPAISLACGPEDDFIQSSKGWLEDSWWNQKTISSNDNKIEYNDCSQCLTNGTGFGIIEVLSSGYNTVRGNLIRDSAAAFGNYSGLYLGEKTSSCLISGNFITGLGTRPSASVAHSAFHLSGRSHTFENNYAASNKSECSLSLSDGQQISVHQLYIADNVFYDNGPLVYDIKCYGRNYLKSCDTNLIFSNAYSPQIKTPESILEMSEWKKKFDKISIIADPLFEAPTKGDFRLKPKSPAWMLGISYFDFRIVGNTAMRSQRKNDQIANKTLELTFDIPVHGSWLNLESGKPIILSAYVIQDDGTKTILEPQMLHFDYSTPNVIEVKDGQQIIPVTRGKTTLTVTAGKKEAAIVKTVDIFVDDSEGRTGILSVPMMNVNETIQVKAYSVSNWEVITPIHEPTVKIENSFLAEYKNGYLNALKSGTTKIIIGDEIREIKIIEAPLEIYLEAVAADLLVGIEKTANAITACEPGDYLVFHGINFYNGFRQASVQIAIPPEYNNSIIQIRIGSENGFLICEMPIKPTKSWGDFEWQNFDLFPYNEKTMTSDEGFLFQKAIKGVQDVFILFKGTTPSGTVIGIKFDISAEKQTEQILLVP